MISACLLVAALSATEVWLDVDPAAGLFERDVDDVLAMIQAFHSPELEVRGVSVVFGNSPLDKGLPIAREVVERFGPGGLSVYAGAAKARALGETNDAVAAMAAALREGPMTILALGPLTNVGSLLKLHPELAPRIDAMVIVAGRRPGQKFTYASAPEAMFPDFNFEADPAAMQVLLDAPIPIVMAPWEVSSHVWLTPEDLAWLDAQGGSGAYIAEKSKSWIAMWRRNFGLPGFNPFDTLGVAWVTHPDRFEFMSVTARIEEGPNDRVGAGIPKRKDFLLVETAPSDATRTIIYCYRPSDDVHDMIRERLAGRPAKN